MLNYKIYNLMADDMRRQIVRLNLISSNVANIDTPNYKAKRLQTDGSSFNDMMLKLTSPRQIQPSFVSSKIVVSDAIARNDGNNVNMEKEMVGIAKVKDKYALISSMLRFKFRSIDDLLNQMSRV